MTGDLIKDFSTHEFACPCCGDVLIDRYLINKLQQTRDLVGAPLVITSGFRCDKENAAIGGSEGSAHLKGQAVDIAATTGKLRFAIVEALITVGFRRIGVYQNHIHADIDQAKQQCYLWYGIYK